jgi:hypothetical protein
MGAEYAPLATDLRDSLEGYGETVTDVPLVAYTPTLAEMQTYDVLIVWSNYAFSDPNAMGDRLADYVDGGGRVVLCCFAYYGSTGWGLGGRLKSDAQYQTFVYGSSFDFSSKTSGWYDGGNFITADLGGNPVTGYYKHNTTLATGATLLAEWTGGIPFVALDQTNGVIGINLYPGNDENYYWSGGYGKLFDNAIEWTVGPPQAIDIGVSGMTRPNSVEDPGTVVTPRAKVKNYGSDAQSNFWVHATIDEGSDARVYADSAKFTGTLNMGDTGSLALPDWTVGASIKYDVRMFVALAGDTKPKNDTAKKTVATIGWKDIPAVTDDADRLTSGSVFDDDADMLYMMGGCPAGYTGTEVTRMQRYDPVTMSWSNRATMPTARGWIHGSYVNHKIYVIGGMDNSGGAPKVNECYDVSSNTWSTAAEMPRAFLAGLEAVYDHRLVYCMGGMDNSYNSVKTVSIYNPSSNTWTTGTDMPYAADMGSAAIIGDTIYIAEAYNRPSGVCWPNLYKGAINPGDPTQITWTAGPALNPNVACGATAAIDEFVYWLGGFQNNFSTVTSQLWRYSNVTGVVDHFAVADYPSTIARNNYMVARVGGQSELYVLAGDLNGDWAAPNNKYRRLTLPPKNNDVGVAVITAPTNAQLTPGSVVTPACYVKNYGKLAQTAVPCSLHITDALGAVLYGGQVLVDVATGESTAAVFPDFNIPDSLFIGRTFAFQTYLAGDQRPYNDAKSIKTMTLSDKVYSYAGATVPVIDGYIDPPDEWADAYTFDCSNIFGWKGMPQGPGAAFAYFKNTADYVYICVRMPQAMARDIGDKIDLCIDENNDGAWSAGLTEGEYQIWVNGSGADEVQYRYHAPNGSIGQWGSVVGSQSVSTTGAGYLLFEARIPIGASPYKITLNDPSNDTVGLYMYALDGANYYGWFRAGLADGDWNNPSLYGKLLFTTQQAGNVGVSAIIAPVGRLAPNTAVSPKATWRNTGTTPMNFTAFMFLTDPLGTRVYSQSQPGTLGAGASVDLTFTPPYTVVDTGTWAVKCSTLAAGDNNAADDVLEGTFKVSSAPAIPPGWAEVAAVPITPSGKAVKDGACLTYDAGGGLIYGEKGYKTGDFYSFDPNTGTIGTWTAKASVPTGTEGKLPYKGASICSDGNGKLYATKGNNKLGFYEYDAAVDSWYQKTDVPPGPSNKKVKGGTGLAWGTKAGVGAAYLLKGYRNEFYKYDPTTSTWLTLTDAPIGVNKKWDKGSWIVSDGQHTLYAFKAKYHEFYKYDTEKDSWSVALTPMPIPGSGGNKKAKDGGAAAWYEDNIYAFKGGNTQEFWRYTPLGDSWREQDTLPRVGTTGKKKKVKAGGALAAYPSEGMYGFKGNKCLECWRFMPYPPVMAQPSREGVMAGSFDVGNVSFAIAPNPLSGGFATIRYSLPKAGPATLHIYDVTGRTVLTQTMVAGRTGTASLDLRKLEAGVYLVKVATEGFSTTQKLVVQH